MKSRHALVTCRLACLVLLPASVQAQSTISYDVIVAGGGAGGFSAAIQAARMGSKVAVVEETDWIGGQMSAAGLSTMDEGPVSGPNPSGLYRELVQKLTMKYRNMGKSVSTCYWSDSSHCFEPYVVQEAMREMMAAERNITLYDMSRVTSVVSSGNRVEGVTISGRYGSWELSGSNVIDATEAGDVIMKSPAEYRVGNGKPGSCIDDFTHTAVVRKDPSAMPMAEVPPKYAQYKQEFERTMVKSPSNTVGYPVSFKIHNQYRGIPDSQSTGSYTSLDTDGIKQTILNWLNDISYANYVPDVTRQTKLSGTFLTDMVERQRMICEGKLKTINLIWYLQDPNGINEPQWSVVSRPASLYTLQNSCPNIPASLKPFEEALAVVPYMRESARIVPVRWWTSADNFRLRGSDGVYYAKPRTDSIGTGDYRSDRHNCLDDADFEADLGESKDSLSSPPGAYQIPFSAVIPKVVDGLLAAEKNFGSRAAAAASRVQPAAMSSGQGAGAIASISARRGVAARRVSALEVQQALMNSGAAISLYIHDDVPFGSKYWPDVQMSGALQVMVGKSYSRFGIATSLTRREAAVVVSRAFALALPAISTSSFDDINPNDWAIREIEAIYRAGFTRGCNDRPLKFCGDDTISREQFAAFISHGISASPNNMVWQDVALNNQFWQDIGKVVGIDIMAPCSAEHFCPGDPVTRGDTARAVVRVIYYRNGLQVK